MTVIRRRPRHLEDAEACALMAWASKRFYQSRPIADFLIHIPNGGKRNAREAGRLRRMGVRAGIPDYLLHVPTVAPLTGRILGGLWIELKAVPTDGFKPRTTDLQDAQLSHLTLCGYRALVAHGWIEAAAHICEYLGLRSDGLKSNGAHP